MFTKPTPFLIVFLSILGTSFLSKSVLANEESEKNSKDGVESLRVEIPSGEDSTVVTDSDLRNQVLTEKLIKMGRSKSQGCTRCHGREGMAALAKTNEWERSIAEFVVKQLTELREGTRVHAVMSSVAAPLSDQDIALIAAWYQSVSPESDN